EQVIYHEIPDQYLFPALDEFSVHKIYLRPDLEVARERNAGRSNKDFDPGLLDGPIQEIHRSLNDDIRRAGDWIIIDNSEMTIEETAKDILQRTVK
ncbi:MAG: hypothetical protein ACK2T7_05800, partial [Anaerolineales bacterium]